MKTSIFLFLIITLALNTKSQNWAPMNPKEIYSYKHDSSNIITNVIKVVDMNISPNNDTIFIISSVAKSENNDSILYGRNINFNKYVANKQFIGNFMKHPQSNIYNFYGIDIQNTILSFNTKLSLNDSWVISEKNNDTATIVSIGQRLMFGITDSIKTIVYNNNSDTIILSKSFGILRFTDGINKYSLAGLHNDNYGENAPNYKDIYNFEINDEFYTEGSYCSVSKGYSCIGGNNKLRILNKTENDTCYIYIVERFSISTYSDYTVGGVFTHHPKKIDTIVVSQNNPYFYYQSELGNSYPGEYLHLNKISPYQWLSQYTKTGLDKDSLGYFLYAYKSFDLLGQTTTGFDSLFVDYVCPQPIFFIARPKLGITETKIYGFEYSYSFELKGYIKNGDTTGYVPTDSYMLDIAQADNIDAIKVFPNPVKDYLYISNIEKGTEITLYNINGGLIRTISTNYNNKTLKINFSSLAKGVYIINMKTNKTEVQKKIIVL